MRSWRSEPTNWGITKSFDTGWCRLRRLTGNSGPVTYWTYFRSDVGGPTVVVPRGLVDEVR